MALFSYEELKQKTNYSYNSKSYDNSLRMGLLSESSSININELVELVTNIRYIENATKYDPGPRILFEKENSKKESLRG